MADRVRIKIGGKSIYAEINSSQTARLFLKSLPLKLSLGRWGDEYYGNCGINASREEDARADMEVGELAIWPDGSSFCIFFGPTPASTNGKPKAISPVNPIGKIEGDVSFLKELPHSLNAEIEKL
ncbi:MAG TPA: hypothetical protein ENI15_19440 [Spirochaetes bacterium]|nr:hypothetical protein [Spirochaetota bacterium]